MIEWLTRLLLFLGGAIAGLFIDQDALKFDIVAMVIAVLLFTILVLIIAFWSTFRTWLKRK
jgi:uncharacterized membrane protein YoaK (UPF0700 family)